MASMANPNSPWSPDDAMELGGKIAKENVHLDHIFHDESSSSSGEESSLVGTRIDGFLDAAADMIQRHLRIKVDGDDDDFDIDHIDDEEEEDEYDGDDDESEAFDYSVFSKHTVESITSHHSGNSRASNHHPGRQTQAEDSSNKENAKAPPADKEKISQQAEESAEASSNTTRSILEETSREKLGSSDESSAKGTTYKGTTSNDECSIDGKSISGLNSIREENSCEKCSHASNSVKKTDDDRSTCSDNQSFGGRSYDERSFAGLRCTLQLESIDDDENPDDANTAADGSSAWLPSSQVPATDEKSVSGLPSAKEDVDDEESASGFQSLGMHSTQDTTIDEGSTTGLQSFGMHSTQETTVDEGTISGSRSTQGNTVDGESKPDSPSCTFSSTHETTIDERSTSGSGSSGLHSTRETTIDDEGSISGSRSSALLSTQETTIDEGSTPGSRSLGLHSTTETTIDEGSTSGSPSFGMHSIQETTIETRSSFGLRSIQECPIDEKFLTDDNFPREEGMFGGLSTKKSRSRNGKSGEGVHSVNEITCHPPDEHSNATRSYDSRSNLETTYDDTRNTSHDSDSAYFTDEYTNYDTTFTQSTMTSKHYPLVRVKERKEALENKQKEQKKPEFYIPKKTRDRVQQNPGSRFVDVRDYYIYSDENSIVTQSSYKKDLNPPPAKRQIKSSQPRKRTKGSQSKRGMKVKRSTLIDKEIKEDESYTEDYDYSTIGSASLADGRETMSYQAPHLRAISDDVSQITMSVALSESQMDESFDGTNSLTTHPSYFESQLETCEECSEDLDTSSVALLSGHSNLDDDQSGKKDSVFDQIRDMGLSMWGKKKEKKERQNLESDELEQEGLNRSRLLEIVKREAQLEEAAWARIERKQSERKDAELRAPVLQNSEFNRFALKDSFAIEKLDETFLSQQNGDNSLVESLVESIQAEDAQSMVSNATSDSVLYNRSQLVHNRRMARNIRKSPSKASEGEDQQPTGRSSMSDVGVRNLDHHEKALEGFLTRKPASMDRGDVFATVPTPLPARGSTPRDKLRARMMARTKFATIDSAKVKRDFLEKSAKSTEQIQPNKTMTPKSALRNKSRVASPAALSPTGILKTMAPQLSTKPVYRSALNSTGSSALKAKRVSFSTPEKFDFVMKEDPEQLPFQSKGGSPDSFDEVVRARRRPRSPFENTKKIRRSSTKRRQPVTPNMYTNKSQHLLPSRRNSSPTSVLSLPSPEDSFSGSPRIANLEFLEQQKIKQAVYSDEDETSEQSSVLMDLSVM